MSKSRITVVVETSLAKALEAKAEAQNIDVQDLIRHILTDGVERDYTFLSVFNCLDRPLTELEVGPPQEGQTPEQYEAWSNTFDFLTGKKPARGGKQ